MESEFNEVLLEPYKYCLRVPGKRIRMKLIKAFNHWLCIPEDKLEIIADGTQMLHNASLLIDDIEDNSSLRRGQPVAHHLYGVPHTINTGNYIYFLALQKILTLDHPNCSKIFADRMCELHEGQGMDIWWRDTNTCPTEDAYKKMVIKKTGGLFNLSIDLMQLFSQDKSDLHPVSEAIGLFFQIRDDYANLCSLEYSNAKTFCEDLTEGKFSYPIIHGIQKETDGAIISSILRQRTEDVEVKKLCVKRLQELGSFEYTRTILEELEERVLAEIESLGGNPDLTTLIKQLSVVYKQL
ncbi:geranylgeranyl pyrophosphate synthase-like [Anneissia japonica]|uniref:geranylgeranyl pyrophosphate synthase-like n=1 Tax=Anneissia japonica TaxID=1529436 RepID=UPI0014256039|nr:geranylgeranyl pyrophosphate synthase-like [Anneissia japonica]XP_033122312.1 geranylgeranyl pyrophosphate synthase-like [Anneissia japonica]XP_033122314.1 geranylgeranyl pyrophosphate synthase-like [Anneissia japonica]XP_033122315.1 geranylgeranyl pyrophosphate synthase-like [Anneissia japonica]